MYVRDSERERKRERERETERDRERQSERERGNKYRELLNWMKPSKPRPNTSEVQPKRPR